jgi:hypothetical protein
MLDAKKKMREEARIQKEARENERNSKKNK